MNPVIFYHANCADGFGAAFAASQQWNNEAEYVACGYDFVRTLDDFDLLGQIKEREVFILDFSFPRDVTAQIIAEADHTTWIDHHKSAFDMWLPGTWTPTSLYQMRNDKVHIMLDNCRSGALLAWDHFCTDDAPLLIKHIDDYDRWAFKYPDTKAFNKALWSMAPWSFDQWERIQIETFNANSRTYQNFIDQGEALLRDHNNLVSKHIEKSRTAMINGNKGLAINAPGYVSSDAGHELAVQSGTFGMTYTIDEHLMVKCSLRSKGDYDVSALAKLYGGGGHRNAAGFECSVQHLINILTHE